MLEAWQHASIGALKEAEAFIGSEYTVLKSQAVLCRRVADGYRAIAEKVRAQHRRTLP